MFAQCCDVTNAMCTTGGVVYIKRASRKIKILNIYAPKCFFFLLLCPNYPFILACLECASCFVRISLLEHHL